MNIVKSYTRQSFLKISIIMLTMAFFFIISGYLGWRYIFSLIPIPVLQDAANQSLKLKSGLDIAIPVFELIHRFFIPVILFAFICFSLILWLTLRRSFVRLMLKAGISIESANKRLKPSKTDKKPSNKRDLRDLPIPGVDDKKTGLSKKEEMEINQRLYLHLLSVLQREGRLLDFFSEDLSEYEDAQIGSAVRNIQENCKKTINKYLKPTAVIDQNEGDQVSVPADFDTNTIKVVGNVTGKPPFNGILRHKGWQVAKIDLPTLISGQNPRIIAPAEIEIL